MSDPLIRPYDPNRDRAHCLRIMKEIGWNPDEGDSAGEVFDQYISDCDVLICESDGEAETWTICRPGTMRYLDSELSNAFVTGVATSHVARGRGFALRTTAQLLERAAQGGAAMARLGMFDQGFYDRLGFGSLGYLRLSVIDPRQLRVPRLNRSPIRLGCDDAAAMHACRRRRMRWHGACNVDGIGATLCEMLWEKTKFGLGFRGSDGELTHCMLLKPKGEHGPYHVDWMAYETPTQLLELLGVLKSLGDQVHGFQMIDPPHVQLQDMLSSPFVTLRSRHGGDFDSKPRSNSWEQVRILNLESCIAPVTLPGNAIRFNLELTDPIDQWLSEDASWRGLAGTYTVTLGPHSSIEHGADPALDTLCASVGAWTRFWIGARPAQSLLISDEFECAESLATALDAVLRLPEPLGDWAI